MARTIYRIRDLYGELVAEHLRIDSPAGKRLYWRRPGLSPEDGLGGLSTAELPLYGSEQIGRLSTGQTVVVTEGERAADAVRALGVPALGTVTGASSCPGEDALSPLLPFDVVLWPDHDPPGEAHMARVASTLLRLGGSCRRLAWGTRKGDDAADFVCRGGLPSTLQLLLDSAAPWRLEPTPVRPVPRPTYAGLGRDRAEAARSKLLDVIEAKLGPPRKRVGRSLFWRCPFHAGDDTPSFKADLREPFWVCFGCGAKGDVFSFLARHDSLSFKDALTELAPPRQLGSIPRLWA